MVPKRKGFSTHQRGAPIGRLRGQSPIGLSLATARRVEVIKSARRPGGRDTGELKGC